MERTHNQLVPKLDAVLNQNPRAHYQRNPWCRIKVSKT
jgi:hypothetical protein